MFSFLQETAQLPCNHELVSPFMYLDLYVYLDFSEACSNTGDVLSTIVMKP